MEFPLRALVTTLLAQRHDWLVRDDDFWCQVSPRSYPQRVQGWKLHVSATWLSAPMVLYHAARILIAHGCAFKFASTINHVRQLTNKNSDRAQAGKFITAYPRDDDHLRALVPLLDEATAGMPGPAILSDRPYRPGSLVHYRYGAFTGMPVLTNEGSLEAWLEAPDGTPVKDAREPWFSPPPWATLPFESPDRPAVATPSAPATGTPPADARSQTAAAPADGSRAVLLAGRFAVEKAISHSARGGVYRAVDRQTGQRVVIKQARPHIVGLNYSRDARDDLRHEAKMLELLEGLAPQPVKLFEDGPYLFLAAEELDGKPLATWLSDQIAAVGDETGPDSPDGPPVDEALQLASRLADLVDAVHDRGVVFRDLSLNNVFVTSEGELRLVDAELAARPGTWVSYAHTPGFGAPEVINSKRWAGPAPGREADHFALGAILCHLAVGTGPTQPDEPGPDGAPPRTSTERIDTLLRYAGARNPAARRLAPAIRGLTADDPAHRWDTARLREWRAEQTPDSAEETGTWRSVLEPEARRRLLDDTLSYLVDTLRPASDRMVPTSQFGAASDPLNVQHGAGGVLAVLVRAAAVTEDARVRGAVARVARWVDRRYRSVSPLLPGLYYGRAGTAWALYEAGEFLEDPGLVAHALDLVRALPVRWPNPDVTHGSAGSGLAHLHLWYATKEPDLLDRALVTADSLVESTLRTADGHVYWRVDPTFNSTLAGMTYYGFAHGVAGIGAFLLAAAEASGRDDLHAAAVEAGESLVAATVRRGGITYWPNDVSGPSESDLRYHWCSGASGVGTFLWRLGRATGDERYLGLAHEAAATVRQGRWFSGVAACHGLAGNGEYLLDLAADGDGPYREWAEEIAACLYAKHVRRGGRAIPADGSEVNLDYAGGLAGVVGFLLRLEYGGPRWWMVDRSPTDPVGARTP